MAASDEGFGHVAAVFGVTGLVGRELAGKLLSTCQWKVYGIARRPDKTFTEHPNYHFISCDLLDPSETQKTLYPDLQDVTHVFWITWASQFPLDSQECFEQNKAMMSNALNVILPTAKKLKHFSLQTGTKHYVSLGSPSPQDNTGGCYYENSPRVDSACNFYYALEDLLQERLPGYQVTWSIHRPGLIMGCSRTTLYNFIGSLCVYGTLCKYLNLPFVFGGTKQCWEQEYIDASDARLVAEQHIWAATSRETFPSRTDGQAYNAINGESCVWKEIWQAIGIKLGVSVSEETMFSEIFMFSSAMADKGGAWKEIVTKERLVETKMEDLANWDFLDILFRFPVKMLGTRDKADELGFKTRCHALDSIFYWIDAMRAEKFIP